MMIMMMRVLVCFVVVVVVVSCSARYGEPDSVGDTCDTDSSGFARP